MSFKESSSNMNIKQWIKAALAVFLAFACYVFAPESMGEASRRTLFVFVWAALFWALEIIPLYATSLSVVLLLTFLLCRPGGVLKMDEMGYTVFMLPFGSSIIMLFFGGLVMAVAMQKYDVDKLIASKMLVYFGSKPYFIMFGFMLATAFLSMWMSNTATTAMMMAMLIPLLKQLDSTDPFRTALVLSVPFAANIGGLATPIGTPPNAIAIGILANQGIHLNFISWMKMAFPLAMLLLVFCSILLITMFAPQKQEIRFDVKERKASGRSTLWVIMIVALTVVLWLTSGMTKIPSALTALLAAGMLAAAGLLERDDFKNIDWDVLVLMWGGLALGKGMEISGLSQWIVTQSLFEHKGFLLVVVFSIAAIVMSTFMSNTATANLLIPVAIAISGENHILLVSMIALSCSFAMALPISTPPNAIAFASNMLKSKDMFKAGVLVSLIALILIVIGYRFIIPRAFGLS